MNKKNHWKDILQQKNLNFINNSSGLNFFLENLENISPQYAKELQEILLADQSAWHLGNNKQRKEYYKQAIKKEKVYEGNYTFDARIIFITSEELDILEKQKFQSYKNNMTHTYNTNIISWIYSWWLSSWFWLIHLENRTNIWLFDIPSEAINVLAAEKKDDIIHLFQKRASEGNHDWFHNKSMDTIDKVLVKERIYSIKEMLSFLHEEYPIILSRIIKYPKFRYIYNYINKKYLMEDIVLTFSDQKTNTPIKKKNNDDIYIKRRKFYNKYIRDPKRKKIDVPDILGWWRTKRYWPFFSWPPETHMYEYFSILTHFRFLNIVYQNHPEIEQQIIADTKKYLSLIQWLSIDQKHKDFWIGIYLRFTARSIDLEKLDLEKYMDYIPEISDSYGKLDIYTFNNILKEDVEKMNQGYTIT